LLIILDILSLGGERGRMIIFNPENNELYIKMVKKGPDETSEKII